MKVYVIEYVECDFDGGSFIDDKAFTSYRAASQHLLDSDYTFNPSYDCNSETKTHSYNLQFEFIDVEYEGIETEWVAHIKELELVNY